jgi:ketosteroid isomerase-like protein
MKVPLHPPFWVLCVVFIGLATPDGAAGQSSSCRDGATLQAQGEGRKTIDEFNHLFVEACRKMDNAGTVELWAADGVDLLPGLDPMVGKSAIAKWLNGLAEQSKGAKVLQCDVDWQKIEISGDVAYEWGINTQTVSIPNQAEPFKNKGKISLILRRQTDGSWKLALESWNNSPKPSANSE